jgi:hypothetical protein
VRLTRAQRSDAYLHHTDLPPRGTSQDGLRAVRGERAKRARQGTRHGTPSPAPCEQAWCEQCLDCDSNAVLTSPSPRQPASVLSVEPEGARNGDGEIVPVSWNEESRRRSVRATARRLVLELQVPHLHLLITG